MKINKQILLENTKDFSNKTLVIVDIQPAYESAINFMDNFVEFLNENNDNFNHILFLYNGEDFGMESFGEISDWYSQYGLEEVVIDYAESFEKNYAFFRSAMDSGYDTDEIVIVAKYMYKNDISDSRELSDNELNVLDISDELVSFLKSDDAISIPDVIDILKDIDSPLLVGGSTNECLEEVRMLFDILDISYEEYSKFVY